MVQQIPLQKHMKLIVYYFSSISESEIMIYRICTLCCLYVLHTQRSWCYKDHGGEVCLRYILLYFHRHT